MPPIGLGYLQSYLKKNSIEADILDLNNIFFRLADTNLKKEWLISCNAALEKNILSILRNRYPQDYQAAIERLLGYPLIGFSCFKSNFASTLEIINLIKSKKQDIRVVLGGPEVTRQFFKCRGKWERRLTGAADFLVAGEGERPLLYYLENKKKAAKIAKFQQLSSLGRIGFPKYTGLDFADYPQKNAVPLQFCRGCIRKCSFCSERLLYRLMRTRNINDVIEEIKFHKKENSVEYFVFFDSLINADLMKLENLCDKIIESFGAIKWEAQIIIRRDMPQRLLEKMKKSGCYNLFIGLESGADKTLRAMRKGFTSSQAKGFFKQLNRAGLSFGISMIVGFPGETEEDFQESLNFVLENRAIIPKIEQVNPFTYYDGTDADKQGDYKINKVSLRRLEIFIEGIKRHNFKYTNAFLGNLIPF